MKRVLSIDGGGIRGLIPAVVCQKFEELSGQSIHELFDLIGGSSTGGILALGLSRPIDGMPAQDLVKFYMQHGGAIFSAPRDWLTQWFRPKFESSNLQNIAARTFGESKLSEAIVEVLVIAYDIQLRRPIYLRRQSARGDSSKDYMMRDIVVGTSAAPTIFPPARLGKHFVIDGGIVANNPACAAYAHAKNLWPDEDIILVSLGTGNLALPLSPQKAQGWGRIGWIRPLIDSLFDGTSHTAHDFFRLTQTRNYSRFQGGLNELTESLDSVTDDSLKGLEKIGTDIADLHEGEILTLIERLKRAGKALAAKITKPAESAFVALGDCLVEGTIDNCDGEALYVFTGKLGRYWPSAQIKPEKNRWTAKINVGHHASDADITLAKVDQQLANYIEFYRTHANTLHYPGLPLEEFSKPFDRVHVYLDHRH